MSEQENILLQQILSVVTETRDKVNNFETKVDNLEAKVNNLEKDVDSLKLTVENEIRPNISEVASCHFNLSKKLDAATTSRASFADLQIRIRVLESQVREIKMLYK